MTRDELLAARTGQWGEEDREALSAVVRALRPSPHHLTDVLDWLDDIASRDGVRAAAVLAEPTMRAAFAAPGSPPDRWKRWKESLRRRRYPRLAAREHDFTTAVRALELGRTVAIAPPLSFEGGTMTLTIKAASAADLDATLDRLAAARRRGALAALFDLLDA